MSSCSSESVRPGRLRLLPDRDAHDDLVRVTERDRQDRVELLLLLDQPHHLLRRVAEVLGRLRQVEQTPERRGIDAVVARAQHPELQPVLHLVESILELADLGGEALIAQHEGRVGEADRHLGDVLHLDEHVDGPVEVGQRAVLGRHGRLPVRCRRQLPEPRDPRRRAAEEDHVAGEADRLAVDVGDPVAVAADRHDAHPGLHGQLERRQRAGGRGGCPRGSGPGGTPPRRSTGRRRARAGCRGDG